MRSDRVLKSRSRRTVNVTLVSGSTFRGVLFEYDGRALVLRNAEALGVGEDRRSVQVDGEMVLLWEHVTYLQFVS